ncbi:Hypothetical predicted protein, partial [Podarcis lilfordi]
LGAGEKDELHLFLLNKAKPQHLPCQSDKLEETNQTSIPSSREAPCGQLPRHRLVIRAEFLRLLTEETPIQ